MRGAIVFLGAFLLFLVISLGYPELPPGKQIYDAIVEEPSDYPVLGISVDTLAIGIFNGVIYGIIAWLGYTIIDKLFLSKKTVEVKAT
ncbi:hypothetical protein KAI12_05350 [Candidatus Bathyarchaeota archaeon]|nr:hypothetical protein [Candidatus Bathyarchaeota archaeon]